MRFSFHSIQCFAFFIYSQCFNSFFRTAFRIMRISSARLQNFTHNSSKFSNVLDFSFCSSFSPIKHSNYQLNLNAFVPLRTESVLCDLWLMIVQVRTKYLISSSIQKKLHDKRLAYFGFWLLLPFSRKTFYFVHLMPQLFSKLN